MDVSSRTSQLWPAFTSDAEDVEYNSLPPQGGHICTHSRSRVFDVPLPVNPSLQTPTHSSHPPTLVHTLPLSWVSWDFPPWATQSTVIINIWALAAPFSTGCFPEKQVLTPVSTPFYFSTAHFFITKTTQTHIPFWKYIYTMEDLFLIPITTLMLCSTSALLILYWKVIFTCLSAAQSPFLLFCCKCTLAKTQTFKR